MSNKKILLVILPVLFVLAVFGAFYLKVPKQENKTVVSVCSEAGFIPFEMRKTNGDWDGYEIVLLQNFLKETNREINLVDIAFDGLIPALLTNNNCDIIASAMGVNAEREKVVIFSDSIYQSAYAGVTRAGQEQKFLTANDINKPNVNIAVQQGTEAALYVQNNYNKAKILKFDNNSLPLVAVITGKADIFIDDSVFCEIAVKRKLSKLGIVKPEVFIANRYSAMAFAFRKNDEKLRNEFNLYLSKISKNGELKKLKKDYFEDMIWLKDFSE